MEKGDKIVCLKNLYDNPTGNSIAFQNNIYTFKCYFGNDSKDEMLIFEDLIHLYDVSSFMLLSDCRKNKLIKIKKRINGM